MAKSIEFAKEHGLPELHHVLTPRTTGFEVSLCGRVKWEGDAKWEGEEEGEVGE